MSARRIALTLLFLGTAPLALPATASAIYNTRGDCLVRSIGRSDYTAHVPSARGGHFEVWARPADRAAAETYARMLDSADVMTDWPRPLRLARDVGTAARPLIVYALHRSRATTNWEGTVVSYCGEPQRQAGAVVIEALANREWAKAVIVHELFHAFQGAVAGGLAAGNWWTEATAEWAGVNASPNAASASRGDLRFMEHPEIPLDSFTPRNRDHAYGSFRFIDWLMFRRGPIVWKMFREIFRRAARLGDNQRVTPVVEDVVSRGIEPSLGQELAHFWGAHLRPTEGFNVTRHPAREQTWNVQFADGVRVRTLRARHLAARLLDIRVDNPRVKAISVSVQGAPPRSYTYVNPGELQQWSTGRSVAYCLRGAPQPGMQRWPGNLPIAWTNAGGSPAELPIKVGTSTRECAEIAICETFARRATERTEDPPVCRRPSGAGTTGGGGGGGPSGAEDATECANAREGRYRGSADTPSFGPRHPQADDIYVELHVECYGGNSPTIQAIGGQILIPCGPETFDPGGRPQNMISLGPPGGNFGVLKDLPESGAFEFTYRYPDSASGSTFVVRGQFSASTVGGTIVLPRGTSSHDCYSEHATTFGGTWYVGS